MIEINGYKFDGGGACPEQYEVYKDDKYVAYVRFRWGSCAVHTKPLGEYIYSYDNFEFGQGCFDTEKQRMYYLRLITKHIERFYQPKKPKRKYTRKKSNNLLNNCFSNLIYQNLFNDIKETDKLEPPHIEIKRTICKEWRKLGDKK